MEMPEGNQLGFLDADGDAWWNNLAEEMWNVVLDAEPSAATWTERALGRGFHGMLLGDDFYLAAFDIDSLRPMVLAHNTTDRHILITGPYYAGDLPLGRAARPA